MEVQDGDDTPIYTTFKTCRYDTVTGERLFWDEIIATNSSVTDTEIGDVAFYRNFEIAYISIPDSVTNIGSGAFCNCSFLTSINLTQ